MTEMTTITVQVPTALLTEMTWRQEECSTAGSQVEKCGPTTSGYVTGVRFRAGAEASRALSGVYMRLAATVAGTPFERPVRSAADALVEQAKVLERHAARVEGR